MASMIDFKQLMKEERERFKQQTKKNLRSHQYARTKTHKPNRNITVQESQENRSHQVVMFSVF